MKVNGTLINYYFHCKRQCYLHGNRLNMEDNSEIVKIGKALHEERFKEDRVAEIQIDNIKIDKLTKDYVVEVKKSDADMEASKWQLILYLSILKEKGIIRKGKLECIEKNKKDSKTLIINLDDTIEEQLNYIKKSIEDLLDSEEIPEVNKSNKCKKCAYYEYCYV